MRDCMKDLVADACVPRKCVDKLRELGYDVLYINETYDPSMPDREVKNIGYSLRIPIATMNVRHFEDYADLIPLPSKKNINHLIREIEKYMT